MSAALFLSPVMLSEVNWHHAKVCSCLQEAGECLMSVKHAVAEEMNFVHSSGGQFVM